MELFKQTKSIARRLIRTNIIVALFFLISSASIYLSSREFLRGLTELRGIVEINETIRKVKNLFPIMNESLSQVENRTSNKDIEGMFLTAYLQTEELLDSAIEENNNEFKQYFIASQSTLRALKNEADRIFLLSRFTKSDLLILQQLTMEIGDDLNRAQILMTVKSNNIFSEIYDDRYRPIIISVALTALFLLISLGLGFSISSRINKSIQSLVSAIRNVSDGDLGFKAPILDSDEIGLVTHAFNQMAGRLQSSTFSKDYVENILDSMLDSLFVLSKDGTILKANQAAISFLGYSEAELIGKPYTFILTTNEKLTSDVQNAETLCLTKAGQRIPVFFSLSKLHDTAPMEGTYVCTVKDITERKKTEKQLEERNIALDQANKELESFSYSVSHDLRSPLRAVDGFGQALLEDYSDKIDLEGQRYLDRIRLATQRMGKLIDDILKLSRISRAEISPQRFNISLLAHEVIEEQILLNLERKINFVVAEDLYIEGDMALMKIVLDNLIGNSIKYTSKHTEARIEFGSFENSVSERVYFVRDDGAGFDMAYSTKLFGAFQRLHLDKEFPGTGVGLATVQRVIHRHQGRIWAEGEIEKGATVYFTLGVLKN